MADKTTLPAGYYIVEDVLQYHGEDFDASDWRVQDKEACHRLGWDWSHKQKYAYGIYVGEVCRRYNERNKNQKLSLEEKYEMQAAFGRGVKVVNVLTGEETTT